MRLEQSQAEAKRHFENYVNMRDQLNQLMEKQLASPDSTANKGGSTTPRGTLVKGGTSKLRKDLGSRAFEATLQEQ